MEYRLRYGTDGGTATAEERGVKRVSDGTFIPPDARNADWHDYLKWVEAGGAPLPPED